MGMAQYAKDSIKAASASLEVLRPLYELGDIEPGLPPYQLRRPKAGPEHLVMGIDEGNGKDRTVVMRGEPLPDGGMRILSVHELEDANVADQVEQAMRLKAMLAEADRQREIDNALDQVEADLKFALIASELPLRTIRATLFIAIYEELVRRVGPAHALRHPRLQAYRYRYREQC